MTTTNETKQCSRCKQEKPIDDFGLDNRRGIPKAVCRPCDSEIHRLRYHETGLTQEQKERAAQLSRERRESYKKRGACIVCKKKAYGQIYCQQHREERRAKFRGERAEQVRKCPGCNVSVLRYRRKLCETCSNPTGDRFRAIQKRWRDAQKLETFNKYGGARCACCGESEVGFLTIDHVNNDGAAHRREIFSHTSHGRGRLYTWLKKHKYPEGFRVLCFNCNCGRQYNGGLCPHQQKSVHPLDSVLSRFEFKGEVH